MSTEYVLDEGDGKGSKYGARFAVEESSCEVTFSLSEGDGEPVDATSRRFTAQELRQIIIRQIEVLSYISEDPEEVLARFNVDYGQQE